MKTIRLAFSLLVAALLCTAPTLATAQVCQVDSQYTSPGIYPSDTLPDMLEGSGYSAVVQFVFPSDTTVSGFTLNFDSFIVASVSNIPNGIDWECNENHPTCHYICNPPSLTRGCVTVFGTPTAGSPGYPAYDSIIVTGVAYVTVPFVGVQSFPQDIPVYYRAEPLVAVDDLPAQGVSAQVLGGGLQPMVLRYKLSAPTDVTIETFDLLGHRLWARPTVDEAAGTHDVALNTDGCATGIYVVRVTTHAGAHVTTHKFTVRN